LERKEEIRRKILTAPKLVIDLQFEDDLEEKEVTSLAQ
jgi:Trm5-related predicted tRNA methylase